jgi:hypothetical protein
MNRIKRLVKCFFLKLPKNIVGLIVRVSGQCGEKLISFSKYLHIHYFQRRAIPWYEIYGDYTLRLDYDLDENSIVFDMGGYVGEWSEKIFAKYDSHIFIFEPVKEYAEGIKKLSMAGRCLPVWSG